MKKKYWFAVFGGVVGLIPSVCYLALSYNKNYSSVQSYLLFVIYHCVGIPGDIVNVAVLGFAVVVNFFSKNPFEQVLIWRWFVVMPAVTGVINVITWSMFLYWLAKRTEKNEFKNLQTLDSKA